MPQLSNLMCPLCSKAQDHIKFFKQMKYLIIILLITSHTGIVAQSMSRSVVGTAGAHSRNLEAGISLTWTLGEIATENIGESAQLQQGFHQIEIITLISAIHSIIPASDWSAFPNPAHDYIHIQTDFKQRWHYEIVDLLGRQVLQGKAQQARIQLQLPNLDAGMYIIRVHNQDGLSKGKNLLIQH